MNDETMNPAELEEIARREAETKAEAKWLEDMVALCQEQATPQVDRKECGPEVAELEKMFSDFEANHSTDELLLITDLTPEDAPNHPTREPAKIAVGEICNKLRTLEKETNIDAAKYQELNDRYRTLSRAVGILNNGVVDHTR